MGNCMASWWKWFRQAVPTGGGMGIPLQGVASVAPRASQTESLSRLLRSPRLGRLTPLTAQVNVSDVLA